MPRKSHSAHRPEGGNPVRQPNANLSNPPAEEPVIPALLAKVSTTTLRQRAREILEAVRFENRPCLVENYGGAVGVILSVRNYEQLTGVKVADQPAQVLFEPR
jgi:hypothetical protein